MKFRSLLRCWLTFAFIAAVAHLAAAAAQAPPATAEVAAPKTLQAKLQRGNVCFDGNGGAVYLFDGSTGEVLQTFVNPVPTAWDAFGMSVAPMGGNIVVGAQFANTVYVFEAIPGSQTFVTDADGNYMFADLQPGTYRVVPFVQDGYVPTLASGSGAYTRTIETGETFSDLDFGNVEDQLPFARDDAYSMSEDSTLTIDVATGVLANDTDSDGDALTVLCLWSLPPPRDRDARTRRFVRLPAKSGLPRLRQLQLLCRRRIWPF